MFENMTGDRDELHQLIDTRPEDQVEALLADVRRCTRPRPGEERTWPLSWFGAIDRDDLPADLAGDHDKYLAESGFGTFR
jgi:hypothetical protein